MSTRLGLLLIGLLVALGCNRGGSTAHSEPPASSYTSTVFQLRFADQQTSVDGARVSPEFWGQTEIRPAIGRLFVPEEYAAPSDPRVVVLSHYLWEQSFGSDPSTIGKTIALDGVPTTVVGILSPEFRFPENARLWVPKTSG